MVGVQPGQIRALRPDVIQGALFGVVARKLPGGGRLPGQWIDPDAGKVFDFLVLRERSSDVAKGHIVELRNFGVFEVRARIGRISNRPGSDVALPSHSAVKVKPGKQMREAILKLSPAQAA